MAVMVIRAMKWYGCFLFAFYLITVLAMIALFIIIAIMAVTAFIALCLHNISYPKSYCLRRSACPPMAAELFSPQKNRI